MKFHWKFADLVNVSEIVKWEPNGLAWWTNIVVLNSYSKFKNCRNEEWMFYMQQTMKMHNLPLWFMYFKISLGVACHWLNRFPWPIKYNYCISYWFVLWAWNNITLWWIVLTNHGIQQNHDSAFQTSKGYTCNLRYLFLNSSIIQSHWRKYWFHIKFKST